MSPLPKGIMGSAGSVLPLKPPALESLLASYRTFLPLSGGMNTYRAPYDQLFCSRLHRWWYHRYAHAKQSLHCLDIIFPKYTVNTWNTVLKLRKHTTTQLKPNIKNYNYAFVLKLNTIDVFMKLITDDGRTSSSLTVLFWKNSGIKM